MEIRQLQSFVTLVHQDLMSYVTDELHNSQSSIYHHIQQLEQEIGYKLFNGDFSLTNAGEVFYQHANDILKYFQVLEEKTKVLELDMIQIGYLEATAYWLPNVLLLFKEKYPNIRLNLIEMDSEAIKKALLNYDIHFGITKSENNTKMIEFTEIYEEEYVVITPLHHPLHHKSTIHPSELSEEHFIYTNSCSHIKRVIENRFKKANIEPKLSYSTENLASSIRLVEAGLGISIVPKNMITPFSNKRIHILHFDDSSSNRTIALACKKNRYHSTSVDTILNMIKEQFAMDKLR